jgi:ATP-dependent Clp protease ATP-binding subunit ClpC
MFERYDEPARRTLFFARFEASRLGISSIETEHVLLGLMREPRGHARRLLLALPLAEIRTEMQSRRTAEKIATSVEIPLSVETKRVLEYACEEADGLTHRHIGPEHLLLGLMREADCRAASTLARHGLRLESAREQIRESFAAGAARSVSQSAVLEQLEYIMESAGNLETDMEQSGNFEAAQRVEFLLIDLQTLKSLLDERQ